MTPFEVYRTYLSVKKHFEPGSTYDYAKYRGKVSCSSKSFESRPDRMWFDKLAKHENPLGFLVANLSHNPKAYIRDLSYSQEAQRRYEEREKRLQSLSYTVANECARVGESLTEMVRLPGNGHAPILQAYLRGDVSLETLCALDILSPIAGSWEKCMGWEPITKKACELIRKNQAFLEIDKEAVRSALLKKFTS